MREKNFFVSNYMKNSPVYVQETDTLLKSIEAMKKFKVDTISVIKDDFYIVGCLTREKINEVLKSNSQKNILKKLRVKDVIGKDKKEKFPLIIYPTMEIENAFSLMKCLNNICAPVAESPFEKKMVGVLWLADAF